DEAVLAVADHRSPAIARGATRGQDTALRNAGDHAVAAARSGPAVEPLATGADHDHAARAGRDLVAGAASPHEVHVDIAQLVGTGHAQEPVDRILEDEDGCAFGEDGDGGGIRI